MDDKLAIEQISKDAELQAYRNTRMAVDWQTISQFILPNISDVNETKTESVGAWTQNIFDTTGIESSQILAAGIYNMGTPPSQQWAEYRAPGRKKKQDEAEEDDEAKSYMEDATETVMTELGRSNFYSIKGEADNSYACFHTDCIIFDESESGSELFNFVHLKINTYTIEENYKGIVDTVRYEKKMTFRQLVQKFGEENLPEKMKEQSKGKEGSQRQWTIKHCIFPREDSARLPGKRDGKNKPFASVYISVDFKQCIKVGGYDENPILCRRFAKWGTGGPWGYGPSYLALPAVRELNYVEQYLGAAAEKHCYPPILTPSGLDGDVDLRAGGETVYDETSGELGLPREWSQASEYTLGLKLQEMKRQQVRNIYFTDAFKLLNSAPLVDKEMTAYEISQRQAEQLQGVAPAFTRSNKELEQPLMLRAFGIAFRAGKLGSPPQALLQPIAPGKAALLQPDVVVTSRFNDALKAIKNRGIEEGIAFVERIAEQKPEAWDWVDDGNAIQTYFRNAGAGSTLRPTKDVLAIRDSRAQQAQAQQAAMLADQVSKATANLGKSPDFVQQAAKNAAA